MLVGYSELLNEARFGVESRFDLLDQPNSLPKTWRDRDSFVYRKQFSLSLFVSILSVHERS